MIFFLESDTPTEPGQIRFLETSGEAAACGHEENPY
jgi:hypothetical protein